MLHHRPTVGGDATFMDANRQKIQGLRGAPLLRTPSSFQPFLKKGNVCKKISGIYICIIESPDKASGCKDKQ